MKLFFTMGWALTADNKHHPRPPHPGVSPVSS